MKQQYVRGLGLARRAVVLGFILGAGACTTIEKGGMEVTADPDSAEEADAIEGEMSNTDPAGLE